MVIDLLIPVDTPSDAQVLLHVNLRCASAWCASVTSLVVSAELSSCVHAIVVLLDHGAAGTLTARVACRGLLAYVGALV